VSALTFDVVRGATDGLWLIEPTDAAATLRGFSTDTRTMQRGEAFVALRGEQFDGHAFLRDAAEAGAALLIADRRCERTDLGLHAPPTLRVDDTIEALGAIASAHRRALRGRVIAVTGSVGKTTTKRLIHAVLGRRLRGTASPRSFNNHIGVPLTLLAADPDDDYVVVEIGTNAPGEVAALGRIARPHIAVITHAGAAHLEGLGGLDGVVREKASLVDCLEPDGVAIVNGEIAALRGGVVSAPRVVTFGRGDPCDLRLEDARVERGGTSFAFDGLTAHLPLIGEHHACNALAAIAVGRAMGLGDGEIIDALASATAGEGRGGVVRFGPPAATVTVIDDCYNANPESMAAALATLRAYPTTGRRIAVLGDMLELGEAAAAHHAALGSLVTNGEPAAAIDAAHFIGPLSCAAAVAAAQSGRLVTHEPDLTPGAAQRIAASLHRGDVVLVKASRGMRLERVIEAIADRFRPDAAEARVA